MKKYYVIDNSNSTPTYKVTCVNTRKRSHSHAKYVLRNSKTKETTMITTGDISIKSHFNARFVKEIIIGSIC